MKTGPQHSALGQSEGIHWHINPDIQIEYTSSNWKRDTIIEVTYTSLKSGETRIYKSKESDEIVQTNPQTRIMDCLDCHNRPSHNYLSPMNFVDSEITAGNISQEIPEIKSMAMYYLARQFPTKDSAFNYISTKIHEYYQENHEAFYNDNKELFVSAVKAIQNGYEKNVFPYMKAQWKDYPNYLGHVESMGCFRCHNNSFESDDGHVISQECTLCHQIKAQGPAGEMEYATGDSALIFLHPYEMDDWLETPCFECHKELF